MAQWRIRLLVNGGVQVWIGEAASSAEAEAKALEAFPTGIIKSGSEI